MEKTTKPAARRHQERGSANIDPRKAVLEVLQRSGRKVEVGELRTARVKWHPKPGAYDTQVYGYELEESGGEGNEEKYRTFPGQDEPPHVYPMVTLRYTPRPGTVHRCILVTLPSSVYDRESKQKTGEILVSYALPVDRRPLYRTEEWNDDAMSAVTVRNFWKSDRQGVFFYARGPNRKGVVVRDKSFVPPQGECKVIVIEGVSSFTALCMDVDMKQATADGSEMQGGDLALAGDAMQTRLTDDPWFYTYDGHLYAITAVLGGDLSPESTMDELKNRFAELSKSDNPTAQARKFKEEYGIKPSQADKDAFAREWGLIVACYKQMEMNLLRRDMQAKYGPVGADKFRFAMVHVPLTTLADTLKVKVAEVRQLLTEIGLPIPTSVTQVAKPFVETVCGYYITEKDKTATPVEPIVISKPQAVIKPAKGESMSATDIRVDLDALKLAMGMNIRINGVTPDESIAELKNKVEQGWTINGADGQLALAYLDKADANTDDIPEGQPENGDATTNGNTEGDGPTVRTRVKDGKPGVKAQRLATPLPGIKTASTEAKPATEQSPAPVPAAKKAPRKPAATPKKKTVAASATK